MRSVFVTRTSPAGHPVGSASVVCSSAMLFPNSKLLSVALFLLLDERTLLSVRAIVCAATSTLPAFHKVRYDEDVYGMNVFSML